MSFFSFNDFMQKLFGCRVYKISVDGGFTCPNRDGKKATGGCIFCSSGSASLPSQKNLSIQEQVEQNISYRRDRYRAKKFIIYFQSFSNTYAELEVLKKRYDEALMVDKDIVGLIIATRADCIDEEKLKLLASYKKNYPFVSIEYGMQTIHNSTLNLIGQHSSFEELQKALKMTQKYDLFTTLHVILNLPSETKEMQRETARVLSTLPIQGVKIHLLNVLKDTHLASLYEKNLFRPYDLEEYIELLVDFLELLPKDLVIHRLSGGGYPKNVIAPSWLYHNKQNIIRRVKETFERRRSLQGSKSLL